MAVKKKSAPAQMSQAKPAAKRAAKTSAKAAKPAAKNAKVAKPAAKNAKVAKPAAKNAKAKPAAEKMAQAVKPAKATKAAKPALARAKAAPAKAAPSKTETPASAKKSAKAEKPSVTETVKSAARKVAKAVASAASKVLDQDAGRPAPAFDLTDDKGEHVSSSDLAGKPYLLYFYPKDDTPGCTKEACDIRDNFGRFGQQGLRVLGVSPDSQQSHAKFGKKYGLPFTLLSDTDKTLANAYGVWGLKNNYGKEYMGIIRSTFLVGADGLIKKSYRGVKVDGHVDAILQDAKALL
jgi:peroxiredoxin Q/BCP